MKPSTLKNLKKSHTPEAVQERLSSAQKHSYLSDAVLGGVDGCITTFAIVASSVGLGLPSTAVFILGIANLVADGCSMAASNYQAVKSRFDQMISIRKMEAEHIALIPEGEREEIRQIFAKKGFKDDILEKIVDVITSDEKLWIETMLKDEHGLQIDIPNAFYSALATFAAFLLIGLFPLIPFVAFLENQESAFIISCLMAGMMFFAIGAAKGLILNEKVFISGFQTFIIGSFAASLAYFIGDFAEVWVRDVF